MLESVFWVATGFASMFLAMEAAWRMARTRTGVLAGRAL